MAIMDIDMGVVVIEGRTIVVVDGIVEHIASANLSFASFRF